MTKRTFRLIPFILIFTVLLGACAVGQTPEHDSPAAPTRTGEPGETEHQTVMPPTPTETAVPATETSAPEPTPEDREPVIAVEPLTAAVGSEIMISGKYFPAGALVELGIGRVNSEYDLVTTAETDAEGSFNKAFAIPGFVETEDRWVIVATAEEGRIKVFSEELNITG